MGNATQFASDYLAAARTLATVISQFQSMNDRITEDGSLLPSTLSVLGAAPFNRTDLQLGDLTGFQDALKDFMAAWNADNSVLTTILNKALVNKLL